MDKHIHQMQKEKKDDLYTRLTSAPLGKVREEEESKEEMLVPPHTPFLPASIGGNPIVAADQFTTDKYWILGNFCKRVFLRFKLGSFF